MKKKWIALLSSLLIVALTVTGLICVTGAYTDPPELKILANNLLFGDAVSLEYAVSHENADEVSLLLWTEPQTEYTLATAEKVLTAPDRSVTIAERSCFVFVYSDLAAKQMADDVYARAYVKVGETEYYSDLSKYSVLQYAYNKLGKTGTATDNEALRDLLIGMLDYGALAQKYLNYRTDHLANAEFYQITAVGGTLPDGSDHGFYQSGETVTLTAPAADAQGLSFDGWKNAAGSLVGAAPTLNVTVGSANETYTAVYAAVAPASTGLEFDSNGDGTCYVVGMGDCTDSDIVIPSLWNGDSVTEIDSKAFQNETAIISVTLPQTVTAIGARAFNGCASLNKVYFGGTAAQWEQIDIGNYNTPLTSATIEYGMFTVTFAGHDGTVLSTQTVKKGGSAVAPAAPSRSGFTFTGWNASYTNVTADITVTAQYAATSSDPAIVISDATAHAGESVELTVSVQNNPGIFGLEFGVSYESPLILSGAVAKLTPETVPGVGYQAPSYYRNPTNFLWDFQDPTWNRDGEILTLKFDIPAGTPAGRYTVSLIDSGNIFDSTGASVAPVLQNATITVQ